MFVSLEGEKVTGTPGQTEPAPKKNWLKSVAGLMFLGFLVGALIFSQSIKNKAKVGQAAPVWVAEDLQGARVSLSDFKGQTILLNLWTTWCISCKEETPALQAFHERYGDKIKVIGLDVREPVDTIREYMKMTGTTYMVLRDKIGKVTGPYNVRGYPETWFIDENGIARVYWEGPMTFEQMQDFAMQTTGKPIDGEGVGPVQAGDELRAVAAIPDGGSQTIFAATNKGIFRGKFTSGPVKEWTRIENDMVKGDITSLVAPTAASGVLIAASAQTGIVRSDDGGATWEKVGGFKSSAVPALAASPDGRVLYAWVSGSGLQTSSDGGASWSQVKGGLPGDTPISALAVDPANPAHLFAGGEGGALVSNDGGKTWSEIRLRERIYTIDTVPSVFGMAFDANSPKNVYFATNKGVWKSTDGGKTATWLRKSHARLLNSVSLSGKTGSVISSAPNGDIYLSRDGGANWELITAAR